MKQCIVCFKMLSEKAFSTPEHIIPEALNGRIKTFLVCDKCNQNLNKSCDEKFSSSPLIKEFRRAYGLKSGYRKSPSKTLFKDDEGRVFEIDPINQTGMRVIFNPSEIYSKLNSGETVQITVTTNRYDDLKKIVTQVNEQRSSKGLSTVEFGEVKRTPLINPHSTYAYVFTNEIYRGVLKWVYQLAAITNRRFIETIPAWILSHILLTKNHPAYGCFLNNQHSQFITRLNRQIEDCFDENYKGVQVLFLDYIGLGSIGYVRVFGLRFVIHLGVNLFPKFILWKSPFHEKSAELFEQGNANTNWDIILEQYQGLDVNDCKLIDNDGGPIELSTLIFRAKNYSLKGSFSGHNYLDCLDLRQTYIQDRKTEQRYPVKGIKVHSNSVKIEHHPRSDKPIIQQNEEKPNRHTMSFNLRNAVKRKS